eukprot:3623747-Amphidinium_carterae.1
MMRRTMQENAMLTGLTVSTRPVNKQKRHVTNLMARRSSPRRACRNETGNGSSKDKCHFVKGLLIFRNHKKPMSGSMNHLVPNIHTLQSTPSLAVKVKAHVLETTDSTFWFNHWSMRDST